MNMDWSKSGGKTLNFDLQEGEEFVMLENSDNGEAFSITNFGRRFKLIFYSDTIDAILVNPTHQE